MMSDKNDLNEKLIQYTYNNKVTKNDRDEIIYKLNELYLCLVTNIDNKEEYEYFYNMYRNEEYDLLNNHNGKKILNKIQKNLNHSFGILPLDRFNNKDYEKLDGMYEEMDIDDKIKDDETYDETETEDEDYEPTKQDIIIEIQDDIVEQFTQKMKKEPKLLKFFTEIDNDIDLEEEDKKTLNHMKKYINKTVKDEKEKKRLYEEYLKIHNYGKTLLPNDIKILKMDIPIQVKFEIFEKLDSLERNAMSGGHEDNKTRDWINQVLKIPFGNYCEKPKIENLDLFLSNFKNKLDEAIYGQNKVKESLIEIITKWLLSSSKLGHCIAIEGPPGCGKTSLIRDGLSKALNRPFCSFSLAGASDENYLSGFSFTYEGATCGRFAKMVMETGCMNPIIFMDELDKVDTHKSLAVFNKLIEVTDFSQNHEIEDYYFGHNIKFDLSQCIFIFSLNDIKLVDEILKDRLEIIKVDGFNNQDKLKITKNYLIPRELSNYDIKINFTDENIKYIISKISKEEGVRNLKRSIEILMRKINVLRYFNNKQISYYMKDFKIIDGTLNINNRFIDKLLKEDFEKIDSIILRMYN